MTEQRDPPRQPVDASRRRLTKAGLAAPAVLGVLASRPVLGQSLHHCTPSGHISGFASPNPGATPPCNTLGKTVSHYAESKANWPGGPSGPFLDGSGNARLFKDAPAGLGSFHGSAVLVFANAYQVTNGTTTQDATVWDVLKGCLVNETSGLCQAGWVLQAKSGFSTDLTLGQEAIAAAMNAVAGYPASYPIPVQQVVEMFNVVVSGGLYQVTNSNTWNAAEVKAYWQSLHG